MTYEARTSNKKNDPMRSARLVSLFLATVAAALCLASGSATAIMLHPGPSGEPFGPDGTAATSFAGIQSLGIHSADKRLYVLNKSHIESSEGLFGIDVSTPGAFTPLPGFNPLEVDNGENHRVEVDNSGLATSGNIYVASLNADGHGHTRIFGFTPAASAAAGWPVDVPWGNFAVDSVTGGLWGTTNSITTGVARLSSSGVPLSSVLANNPIGRPERVTVDSNGDIYAQVQSGKIYRFVAPGYGEVIQIGEIQSLGSTVIEVDSRTHDLYVSSGSKIMRYSASGTLLEEFATGLPNIVDFAVAEDSGDVYVATSTKVYYFPGLNFALPTTGGTSGPTETGLTVHGTVRPDGEPLTECSFQYVTEAAFKVSGFSDLSSGGSQPCSLAAASIPSSGETAVSATLTGLGSVDPYRYRLVAANANGLNVGQSAGFSLGKPIVETTGSPLRTAGTALLDARVYSHGLPTTYHFEYGDAGPCDANPCISTTPQPTGASEEVTFVSQQIDGLQPGATYHYRVVADNGHPAGPAVGVDMTVTTRTTDAPLSHGSVAGPPGSDRAWEQVSLPDAGGNPVTYAFAISNDGDRAFYRVAGGTPISNTGTLSTPLFAERTPNGWRSENLGPSRAQLVGAVWPELAGKSDLSDQVVLNASTSQEGSALWRLRPGSPAAKVFEAGSGEPLGLVFVSKDASRVLVLSFRSLDPAHPAPPGTAQIYDVSSGAAQLVSLLPDGFAPECSVQAGEGGSGSVAGGSENWVSQDGSLLFFSGCGGLLYVRDLVSNQTKLIGPGAFVKSTPGSAFFTTNQSLEPADSGGNDVYRYDLATDTSRCVTCVVPGLDANVNPSGLAVSADGSRVYFSSSTALLPGAAKLAIYRVDVASGDLAYVAPTTVGSFVGNARGDDPRGGGALTNDGRTLVFASDSPGLNAVGGQQNGGTLQFYRYDDRDRSLTCLSCPQDGSAPIASVAPALVSTFEGVGANRTALSADGDTFAFATWTALVSADQNSARPGQSRAVGTDIYEWRDGRLLLITDGLTRWPPESNPRVSGITPSGKDVFFTAAARYTPDAPDAYERLYDARIGGGFEFPAPPQPCALEVCQGVPKGAPEEQSPGTADFRGAGNPRPKVHHRTCRKGQRRHGKCVKNAHKKHHHPGSTGKTRGTHR